jgi:hypothetical protein
MQSLLIYLMQSTLIGSRLASKKKGWANKMHGSMQAHLFLPSEPARRLPTKLSICPLKKLFKNRRVAVTYRHLLNDYLKKVYSPSTERRRNAQQELLPPHFSVVRPGRASTRVRIVFDGSAPYEGKNLNTEALPAPILQIMFLIY